jgi:hypothetical protein
MVTSGFLQSSAQRSREEVPAPEVYYQARPATVGSHTWSDGCSGKYLQQVTSNVEFSWSLVYRHFMDRIRQLLLLVPQSIMMMKVGIIYYRLPLVPILRLSLQFLMSIIVRFLKLNAGTEQHVCMVFLFPSGFWDVTFLHGTCPYILQLYPSLSALITFAISCSLCRL